MKTAVIYARVSSREQEREGFSIQAQQRLLREYAAKNDFRIIDEFIDVETAKNQGRKRFGENDDIRIAKIGTVQLFWWKKRIGFIEISMMR